MADYRVTCISKPHPQSAHEHITHIGGPEGDNGQPWKFTREKAIEFIDKKIHQFHVLDPKTNKKAYVEVIRPTTGGAPYLRTRADGQLNDNLLSLKQCA